MNETQRNIKRYKAALPGLRERVTATALLLLVSLSMLVSTSLAWYTISSAPEVSSLATTIAANGNLEIALADGLVKDGKTEPDEVAIGDSSSTEGKNIISANVTWGNLVNLSDDSYGLSEVSLRPAKLSNYNLGVTPLYGATYSQDGRVEDISEYYRYTSYATKGNVDDFYGDSEYLGYGVRAISSVKLTSATGAAALEDLYKEAEKAFAATTAEYNGIINGSSKIPAADGSDSNTSYMDALVKLLEIFVNDMAKEVLYEKGFLDSYTPATYNNSVENFYKLLLKYQDVLEKEGETLRLLANMQIYYKESSTENYFETADDLRNATTAQLKVYGITDSTLKSLKSHKADCTKLQNAITGVENELLPAYKNGDKIYWADTDGVPGIGDYVSQLVNINKTYVGSGDSFTAASSIGMSAALTLLDSDPIEVEIRDGVLKNTEARIGSLLRDNDTVSPLNPLGTRVTITLATGKSSIMGMKVDGPRNAAIRTDASATTGYTLIQDMSYAARLQPEPTDIAKKDTYGFAFDFWVRTNADSAILTLEGDPEYQEKDATCTDINGNTAQVYVATKVVKNEQEDSDTGNLDDEEMKDLVGENAGQETITMDVYILDQTVTEQDEDGNEVTNTYTYVYDVNSHVILGTKDDMEGYTFPKKTIRIVTGYDGVDRIWEELAESGSLLEDNTTQGSGSCYVFYADPSDQERILDMLRYFTIAFLDESDDHKATAKLDVDNAYAINGKVTVPLVMVSGPEYVDTIKLYDDAGTVVDTEEQTKRGIITLARSQATWLTAVVYVDGEQIGNENVMEAGVVEGRLNLQFGTTSTTNAANDLPLQLKYRTITAKAESGTQTSTNREGPIEYEYDALAKTVTVTLTVEGDQPENLTGFFTRMIGANHGTKLATEKFECQKVEGTIGTWTAEFELTNPGEYVFLSVLADGSEYELEDTPAVKINGRSINSLSCDPGGGVYYTSDASMAISVSASIAAAPELAPKQVRAIFSNSNGGEFTVILGNTGNGDTASYWDGTARITEGGTYTLEYLVVDGDSTEVSDDQKKENTFVVRLGVRAEIECIGIQAIQKDEDDDAANNEVVEMDSKVTEFPYERTVDHFALKFKVKLYDNQNNEIRSLHNVSFNYVKEGSETVGTDNMNMILSWKDTDGGYYEGNDYINNVGVYKFSNLVIPSNNVITSAADAPVFSVLSPEPPAWHNAGEDNSTADYQYAPNDDAVMYAYFTNADAATAYALIRNDNTGEAQWVTYQKVEVTDGIARFEFKVPENSSGMTGADKNGYSGDCEGSQDGQWTMVAACLQKVYESDDVYHAEQVDANGDPVGGMFFYADGTNGYPAEGMGSITTEVVTKVFTTLTVSGMDKDGVVTLGKSGDTITAKFMEDQTVSGFQVEVFKWNGGVFEHYEPTNLSITYNHDPENYGSYSITSGSITFDSGWTQWMLTQGADKITYTAGEKIFNHAGTYTVSLDRVDDSGKSTTLQSFKVEVYSGKPSLIVSEVSPGTTEQITTTIQYSTDRWGRTSYTLGTNKYNELSANNTEVTVRAKAITQNLGTDARFELPTLKFSASGFESDSAITGVIPAGDSGAEAKTFAITGNGTSSAVYIGVLQENYYTSKGKITGVTYQCAAYRGHGTVRIDTVCVNKDGVILTVTLAEGIIINNPSSIPST